MTREFKKFERRPHDRYVTPLAATLPLRPFLGNIRTFAEPCCANRQLVAHIEEAGPLCIHSGDIQEGIDALKDPVLRQLIVDAIITNPPYTWDVLEPMLDLFPSIAPTWLLLEADFMHRPQRSGRHMPICSDVVSIGQVRWFDETKHKSTSHYAWYRFDAAHYGPTVFHPRQLRPTRLDAVAA